jgi:putative oxidoreductase
MIFPQLAHFTDVALLLLRIMVGIVFMASGWSHIRDPERRSQDIEMSKPFTIFLGLAELAGSLGVILGVLAQAAAIGLILIMRWISPRGAGGRRVPANSRGAIH